MDDIAYKTLYDAGPINDLYEALKKKHSTPENPFLFQVYNAALAYIMSCGYSRLEIFQFFEGLLHLST